MHAPDAYNYNEIIYALWIIMLHYNEAYLEDAT